MIENIVNGLKSLLEKAQWRGISGESSFYEIIEREDGKYDLMTFSLKRKTDARPADDETQDLDLIGRVDVNPEEADAFLDPIDYNYAFTMTFYRDYPLVCELRDIVLGQEKVARNDESNRIPHIHNDINDKDYFKVKKADDTERYMFVVAKHDDGGNVYFYHQLSTEEGSGDGVVDKSLCFDRPTEFVLIVRPSGTDDPLCPNALGYSIRPVIEEDETIIKEKFDLLCNWALRVIHNEHLKDYSK